MKKIVFSALTFNIFAFICIGQPGGSSQLKSIDEVIQGIDSLLDDLDRGDGQDTFDDLQVGKG